MARPFGSTLDNYANDITKMCADGYNITEITEELNKRYRDKNGVEFIYQTVRSWIARHEQIKKLQHDAMKSRRDTSIRKVAEIVPAETIDEIIEEAARSDPFLAKLNEMFGDPETPAKDKFNNIWEVAYQTFIFCCRAVLVGRNPRANILEIRNAQKTYQEGIEFLRTFEREGELGFEGISFDFDITTDIDGRAFNQFMGVVGDANDTHKQRVDEKKEQPELFG